MSVFNRIYAIFPSRSREVGDVFIEKKIKGN